MMPVSTIVYGLPVTGSTVDGSTLIESSLLQVAKVKRLISIQLSFKNLDISVVVLKF